MKSSITFFTLCCVLKICAVVNGRYLVEVRLFNYSNPTGRCRDCYTRSNQVTCCDTNHVGICEDGRRCDSYFIYCLRPLNLNNTERGCSGFEKRTSNSNKNDGALNFSNRTLLGLPNPLRLPGVTEAYAGVQLCIEILDSDKNDPDAVDIFIIKHDLRVGETHGKLQEYSGSFGFVMISLIINVSCDTHFEGSDCTECIPGFTGTDCQQIDHCVGINCSGKGQCVDGVDSFNCSCDPGFTGELCQTNIDDCVAVNCSGNGWCVDEDNSFTCKCIPGYTGPLCDVKAIVRRSNGVGPTIGGTVGGVLGTLLAVIILIIILAVLVFIVLRQRRKQAEPDGQGMTDKHNGHQILHTGDNPVYMYHNQATTGPPAGTATPKHYEMDSDSELERECVNPIYGSEQSYHIVYTTPGAMNDEDGESLPDYEVENIIYGTEDMNTHSELTATMYGTVTDVR